MNKTHLLADILRRTADAIDDGTCIMTNAQASLLIDELLNRPMSKEQASIFRWASSSFFALGAHALADRAIEKEEA